MIFALMIGLLSCGNKENTASAESPERDRVDTSTPEGEKIADKYEVTWSSLFVNRWKDGKETCNNMTEFGFGNARKNPEGFRKGLAEQIRQSLK